MKKIVFFSNHWKAKKFFCFCLRLSCMWLSHFCHLMQHIWEHNLGGFCTSCFKNIWCGSSTMAYGEIKAFRIDGFESCFLPLISWWAFGHSNESSISFSIKWRNVYLFITFWWGWRENACEIRNLMPTVLKSLTVISLLKEIGFGNL